MDDAAYLALAQEMTPGMYRMAYSILTHRQDAEDAVQQALLNAWRCRGKARPGAERAWVMRITVNACYDLARKRRRAMPAAEVEDRRWTPDSAEKAALYDAIQGLPELLRTAFLLKYMEGMTEKEICGALRIPLTSVKNRLFRARKALQKALGEEAAP